MRKCKVTVSKERYGKYKGQWTVKYCGKRLIKLPIYKNEYAIFKFKSTAVDYAEFIEPKIRRYEKKRGTR